GAVNEPPGRAAIGWRLYAGPVGASFANAGQATTNVTINGPGTYMFVLSADDGVHTVAYDAVVVRVTGHNALANLATRVQVGAADNVAIAGFIVPGTSSEQ